MTSKTFFSAIFLLIVLVIGYYFFYFRPEELRRHCQEIVKYQPRENTRGLRDSGFNNTVYQNCLRDFNLAKKIP